MRFIIRLALAAAGLWLAAKVTPGVAFYNWGSLVAAAVLLGLVNALVRPVIVLLTLPFTLITLGLFLLVVNAAMIGLVAVLLRGFEVHGLVPAVMAAIITGAVSWIGHAVLGDGRGPRKGRRP